MEIQITPKQASELLMEFIPRRKSSMIVGAPAIGKTEVVKAVAAKLGYRLIVSTPVVHNPTHANGFAWVKPNAKKAEFVPFAELYEVLTTKVDTIWFWDDLGPALPATKAAYMQWLLARRVGEHQLPDNVTIVAASNRREDRSAVLDMLEAVKSRFTTIVEMIAAVDDWVEWGIESDEIPLWMLAYIRFQPKALSEFVPTTDMTNSPSPRGWHACAQIEQMGLSQPVELAAMSGAVGQARAAGALAYRKIYREMIPLDNYLADPNGTPLPEHGKPDIMYAVATGLSSKVTKTNCDRVFQFAQRLYNESRGDFAALLARDCFKRIPTLANTKAGMTLLTSPLGKMLSGLTD